MELLLAHRHLLKSVLMRSHSWAQPGGTAQLGLAEPDQGRARTCNKCMGNSRLQAAGASDPNGDVKQTGSGVSLLEKNMEKWIFTEHL